MHRGATPALAVVGAQSASAWQYTKQTLYPRGLLTPT
jgi:hypothetical protein